MSKSKDIIKLHPKYGVNPSIAVCFWCGEETGEIILFGGEIKEEAPMHAMASYDPCDKCRENWNEGFALLEASETPIEKGQPPLREGVYPTGNYIVITMEAAEKLFGNQAKDGAAFVTRDYFRKVAEISKEPSKQDGEEL